MKVPVVPRLGIRQPPWNRSSTAIGRRPGRRRQASRMRRGGGERSRPNASRPNALVEHDRVRAVGFACEVPGTPYERSGGGACCSRPNRPQDPQPTETARLRSRYGPNIHARTAKASIAVPSHRHAAPWNGKSWQALAATPRPIRSTTIRPLPGRRCRPRGGDRRPRGAPHHEISQCPTKC